MTVVFAPKKKPPMGGQQQQSEKPPMAGGSPPGGEGQEQDLSQEDIQQVVQKHGPAHKIEEEHDHEGGRHSKTSHHKDAKHHSEHGSAQEAHEHAGLALGMGSGADEQAPDQAQSMDNSVPGY